jgi:hypothetical protein
MKTLLKKMYTIKTNLLLILFFGYSLSFSQLEIKAHTGLLDRHGLGVEYTINDNIGVELKGSFRTRKESTQHMNFTYDSRVNNIFINTIVKKYSGKNQPGFGLYYGAYLRYWQYYQYVLDEEEYIKLESAYTSSSDVWLSSRSHKTSLGLITGYKGKIYNALTWEISFGLGAAPSFLYVEREISTENDYTRRIDESDWLRTHFSAISHLSLGWRF